MLHHLPKAKQAHCKELRWCISRPHVHAIASTQYDANARFSQTHALAQYLFRCSHPALVFCFRTETGINDWPREAYVRRFACLGLRRSVWPSRTDVWWSASKLSAGLAVCTCSAPSPPYVQGGEPSSQLQVIWNHESRSLKAYDSERKHPIIWNHESRSYFGIAFSKFKMQCQACNVM